VHVASTLSLFLISPFCCCSLSRYKKVPQERYKGKKSSTDEGEMMDYSRCRLGYNNFFNRFVKMKSQVTEMEENLILSHICKARFLYLAVFCSLGFKVY
jgi:hypothetical protein